MKFIKKNIFYNIKIFFVLFLFVIFMYTFSRYIYVYINGDIARIELEIILIAFKTMLIIIFPVFLLTLYCIYKYREKNNTLNYFPDWSHSYFLEIMIWFIPFLIIIFLATLSYKTTHFLDPKKSLKSNYSKISIEVVALDWRWLFIYPKYKIATINEIFLPKNIPVTFHITSNTVMNSFFIPDLGSQVYSMAGMKTELNLMANKLGLYKGISSNYSGQGFSNMKFDVHVVKDMKHLEKWIKKVKLSKNKLFFKDRFLEISKPNENIFVQYFSYVDPLLFKKIINIFKS